MSWPDIYYLQAAICEKLEEIEKRRNAELRDYSKDYDAIRRLEDKHDKLEEFKEMLDILTTPTSQL
jgi:hypothetical protein